MPQKNLPEIENGYVILARALLDSTLWGCAPDTFRVAVYLVLTARHDSKPKKFPDFQINRGELVTSYSDIAENCQWFENRKVRKYSRQKIQRIIDELCNIGFCKRKSDTFGTHLSICNYEFYQDSGKYKSDNRGTEPDITRTDPGTYKNGEEWRRMGNNDNTPQTPQGDKSPKKFVPPTVEEVRAYCQERQNSVDAQRFVNFYESKGWYIGKNKMKEWKAAVRTWEQKDEGNSQKQQPGETPGEWSRRTGKNAL